MDKTIVLCWECRKLFLDHYKVIQLSKAGSEVSRKCENCGGGWGLTLYRVTNKEDKS